MAAHASVVLSLMLLVSATRESAGSPIQQDFAYLVKLFGGVFDNSWQFFEDMVEDLPPSVRHLRFTAGSYPETIPMFSSGIKTFYLQEHVNGDPNLVIRQKIYAFQINTTTQELVLKFYGFVNPTKYVNAQDKPGIFNNLTWNDVTYVTGCDMKWTRVEPNLFRSTPLSKCVVPYNGSVFEITDTNDLTPNYLTVSETWKFVSNGTLYRGGTPYNLTRTTAITEATKNLEFPRMPRIELKTFAEIDNALRQAFPVTLYLDLPNCKLGQYLHKPAGKLDLHDDFPVEAYSIDIDTFELFNSSLFGPHPYFGFSDAPLVRTSKGDMYQLREGRFSSLGNLSLTITWLDPATFAKQQQFVLGCQLPGSASSGNVKAVMSQLSLTRVENFGQLKSAIQAGYNFRFYVRYMKCTTGPAVNAYAGGIIEGMKLSRDGTKASFSKSKLITNYQGSGYVTDIVSGTVYKNGFYTYVNFVASDDYVKTFKRVYIETFVCPVTSDTYSGAVDMYYY